MAGHVLTGKGGGAMDDDGVMTATAGPLVLRAGPWQQNSAGHWIRKGSDGIVVGFVVVLDGVHVAADREGEPVPGCYDHVDDGRAAVDAMLQARGYVLA